jgi:hypothetical protein
MWAEEIQPIFYRGCRIRYQFVSYSNGNVIDPTTLVVGAVTASRSKKREPGWLGLARQGERNSKHIRGGEYVSI